MLVYILKISAILAIFLAFYARLLQGESQVMTFETVKKVNTKFNE